MQQTTITIYRGLNRGHRYGFQVSQPGQDSFDSGLIYNDETHANVGVAKHMGYRDKDGRPIRGSRISLNRNSVLGPRAVRMLRNGGADVCLTAASRFV